MKRLLVTSLLLAATTTHSEWKYNTAVDQMSDAKNRYAQTLSDKSLELSFPYEGKNFVNLAVRKKSREDSSQVLVNLDKGQFVCHSGCWIEMRFDDGPVVRYRGELPADNSADMLFITTPGLFIQRASSAKLIRIRLPLFQNGEPVATFTLSTPLVWASGK